MEINPIRSILISFLLGSVLSEEEFKLKANYVETTLPFPLNPISAIFDGTDVYIFGAEDPLGYFKRHIFKFNINTATIEHSLALNTSSEPGHIIVQLDENGDILYSGWQTNDKAVYTFDKRTNNFSAVAKLPYSVDTGFSLKYNQTSILLLGGKGKCNDKLHFHTETFIPTQLPVSESINFCNSAGTTEGSEAFVFKLGSDTVIKLNLETFNSLRIPLGITLDYIPSVVNDGEYAYLIANHKDIEGDYGIIQLNLKTHRSRFIPFEHSKFGDRIVFSPAAVYIPDRNRIYFFGGQRYVSQLQFSFAEKQIYYVDLEQLTGFPWMDSTNEIDFTWIFASTIVVTSTDYPANESSGSSVYIWATLTTFGVVLLAGGAYVIIRRNCLTVQPTANDIADFVEEVKQTHKSDQDPKSSARGNLIWKSSQPVDLESMEEIGNGAFSSVYKATHPILANSHFAVKKISLYNALKHLQWDIGKVLREVENLAEIVNPNVVKMYNCWIEDTDGTILIENGLESLKFHEWSSTQSWFVFVMMELCDSNLRDWLSFHDTMSKRMGQDVKQMMAQIINGLRGIHSKGILHRDIKPTNVFHCHGINVWKIGDLGLSTKLTNSDEDKSVVGCMVYRSPEMNSGSEYTYKTDVFSLGLTFLEVIHIFQNEFIKMQSFDSIRNNPTESLNSIIEDININTNFYQLVEKMLQVNPGNRWDIFNTSIDSLLS